VAPSDQASITWLMVCPCALVTVMANARATPKHGRIIALEDCKCAGTNPVVQKMEPQQPYSYAHTRYLMILSHDQQFSWRVPLIYMGLNTDNTPETRRAAATEFLAFCNGPFVHHLEKPRSNGMVFRNVYSICLDITPLQDPGFSHLAVFFCHQ
jgi:hypothetical protein